MKDNHYENKNNNNAVANLVTNKKQKVATFQFEDNRHEMILQRKLQDLANNSLQSGTYRQLQLMDTANSNVHQIQLKPLSTLRLNVAGEEHGKNDEEDEKNFVKAKIPPDADLWYEADFIADNHLDDSEGEKEHGDPKREKLKYHMSGFHEQVQLLFINGILKSNVEEIKSKLDFIKNNLLARVKNFETEILTAQGEDKAVVSDEKWVVAMNSFVSVVDKWRFAIENWEYPEVPLNWTPGEPLNNRADSIGQNFSRWAKLTTDTIEQRYTMEEAWGQKIRDKRKDAVLDRSIAMHKAALKMYNTKGVWKIGENHLQDIRNEFGVEPGYELLKQSDFDDEFQKWNDESGPASAYRPVTLNNSNNAVESDSDEESN